MMKPPGKNPRSYPPFWEKFIPFFLVVITLVVFGLVALALAVIMGVFPGS